MLLALKWSDNWDVSMLTTANTPAILNISKMHHATVEVICKPKCEVSYTKNMGTVNTTAMEISFDWINKKSTQMVSQTPFSSFYYVLV